MSLLCLQECLVEFFAWNKKDCRSSRFLTRNICTFVLVCNSHIWIGLEWFFLVPGTRIQSTQLDDKQFGFTLIDCHYWSWLGGKRNRLVHLQVFLQNKKRKSWHENRCSLVALCCSDEVVHHSWKNLNFRVKLNSNETDTFSWRVLSANFEASPAMLRCRSPVRQLYGYTEAKRSFHAKGVMHLLFWKHWLSSESGSTRLYLTCVSSKRVSGEPATWRGLRSVRRYFSKKNLQQEAMLNNADSNNHERVTKARLRRVVVMTKTISFFFASLCSINIADRAVSSFEL